MAGCVRRGLPVRGCPSRWNTAVCAVSCALDTMSAIILVSFLVREVVARFLRAFFIVHELVGCVPSCGFSGCFGLFFGPCVFGLVGWGVR